jgi:hypothetical protein
MQYSIFFCLLALLLAVWTDTDIIISHVHLREKY